jgi:hypothetical protein
MEITKSDDSQTYCAVTKDGRRFRLCSMFDDPFKSNVCKMMHVTIDKPDNITPTESSDDIYNSKLFDKGNKTIIITNPYGSQTHSIENSNGNSLCSYRICENGRLGFVTFNSNLCSGSDVIKYIASIYKLCCQRCVSCKVSHNDLFIFHLYCNKNVASIDKNIWFAEHCPEFVSKSDWC